VTRVGTTLRITFTPSRGATRQYVTASLSDGRTPVFVLGAGTRSVVIAHVPRRVRALRVAARGAAHGFLSRVASARG
jgi:hypothetical protein